MKTTKTALVFLWAGLALPCAAQWDYGFDFTKAGSAGLQFLKIGVGARECSMGEATTCLSRGAGAIFWNPAGIAYNLGQEAIFSYTRWLLDIDLGGAAVAVNIPGIATIGISALYLAVPSFKETTVLQQDGTGNMVEAGDLAVGLAVARRFTNRLAMGCQVRYVREQLVNDSFSNVLVDLGAMYDTGFRHMCVSVVAQHFGPDIKMLRDKFRMPLVFKVGLSDELLSFEDHCLSLALDLIHPTDNTERLNIGMEYALYRLVYARGGYRLNSDLGAWSFGFGLTPSLLGVRADVDYSYSDFGPIMGAVNRFTVAIRF